MSWREPINGRGTRGELELGARGADQLVEVVVPRAGHAVDHVRVGLDVQAGPVAEPARGFGDREPGVVARARVRVTQRVEADVAGASKRGITSGGAAVVVETVGRR